MRNAVVGVTCGHQATGGGSVVSCGLVTALTYIFYNSRASQKIMQLIQKSMEKQTSFESAVASVSQQFSTFLAAPIPFLLVVGIVAIGIWRFLAHHYSGKLDATDALLTLRQAQLDDYKEKLSGASPEEARARVDALEQRIEDGFNAMAPRTLSDDQCERMVAVLEGQHGHHVTITQELGDAGRVNLVMSIEKAFSAARWTTATRMMMRISNALSSGIGVIVSDQNNLTEPQRAIINAFKIAEIEFDIQTGDTGNNGPYGPHSVAQIIVSPRIT